MQSDVAIARVKAALPTEATLEMYGTTLYPDVAIIVEWPKLVIAGAATLLEAIRAVDHLHPPPSWVKVG